MFHNGHGFFACLRCWVLYSWDDLATPVGPFSLLISVRYDVLSNRRLEGEQPRWRSQYKLSITEFACGNGRKHWVTQETHPNRRDCYNGELVDGRGHRHACGAFTSTHSESQPPLAAALTIVLLYSTTLHLCAGSLPAILPATLPTMLLAVLRRQSRNATDATRGSGPRVLPHPQDIPRGLQTMLDAPQTRRH
jgi:hypothetical protein